jgi:surface antigen
MASASLAALVGTAATAMAVGQQNASEMTFADNATTTTQMKRVSDDAASRSESRSDLDALASTSNSGDWQLGETSSSMDTNLLSKSIADNPNVAVLMDQDAGLLPSGFNPNHGTGDTGNDYPYGQCTWWAYTRRAQLGLPAGSHFGDARSWGDSARALGYWVDNTARHVGDIVVFAPGQMGADSYYGHVAIVEGVNADGSIKISESNVKGLGVISDRTFTAQEASQLTYIHY